MNTFNVNALTNMCFELMILILIGVFVYLKMIPNDMLILAVGVVIRGALTVIPTISAIKENTAATKENTAVNAAAAGVAPPDMGRGPEPIMLPAPGKV